ncbi:MAG: tyrosine-type recombinase/integrase [Tepidisphaeraceae bacterium]
MTDAPHNAVIVTGPSSPLAAASRPVPALIADAGPQASHRFIEFFTATIRNPHTREAYARAAVQFFTWCESHRLDLHSLQPSIVATYIEQLMRERSAPTVKQHLAAIRMLFDYLVVGQVLPSNPAASVRGPKYVIKTGKTPVLTAEQARTLLDSIEIERLDEATGEPVPILIGLRDRAIIAVMAYSFARISAVTAMNVEDYWQNGKRWWLRLHEKGGKHHEVPAHHNVEAYLDAYLRAARINEAYKTPLFRTIPGHASAAGSVTDRRFARRDALAMVKRRAKAAGLPRGTCNHTFRATGITTYLKGGGTLEKAQAIAAHSSATTTKLYDRTRDELTLDEIERIVI